MASLGHSPCPSSNISIRQDRQQEPCSQQQQQRGLGYQDDT